MHMVRRSSGFTLIELSIVLVIIGLLTGGVLVGREMVSNAEMRAQIADIEKLNLAVLTFQMKYGCLPGDCRTASSFFSGVNNGDGNGKIRAYSDGNWGEENGININSGWISFSGNNGAGLYAEWPNVFDQLSAASMWDIGRIDMWTPAVYAHPGKGYPKMKLKSQGANQYNGVIYTTGGMITGWETAASYVKAGHKIRLGNCNVESYGWGYSTCFWCGLNPSESLTLDTKIDDGKPYSGQVVITGDAYIYRIPGVAGTSDTTGSCGTFSTNSYTNLTLKNRACAVEINAKY